MDIPYRTLIQPVVARLSAKYGIGGGPSAEAMLIAIGLQESDFATRDQETNGPPVLGPATGFWQFERGGGVRGVMRHPASREIARTEALSQGVLFDENAIWTVFSRTEGDELACIFARLLLLTDPQKLPAPSAAAEEEAWNYYNRNWRPGKPSRHRWGSRWSAACDRVAKPQAVAETDLASRVAALERRIGLPDGAAA
jgi:hypothetical protein